MYNKLDYKLRNYIANYIKYELQECGKKIKDINAEMILQALDAYEDAVIAINGGAR